MDAPMNADTIDRINAALDRLDPPAALDGDTIVFTRSGFDAYGPDGQFLGSLGGDSNAYVAAMKATWAYRQQPDSQLVTEIITGGEFLQISTVYLTINCGFRPGRPIMIWETMVFGPESVDGWGRRYSTRAAARHGHTLVVAALSETLPDATIVDVPPPAELLGNEA
jgi:hypothetical protein